MYKAGKPFLNSNELNLDIIKPAIVEFVSQRKIVTRFPLLTIFVNKSFSPTSRAISQVTVRKITYEIVENGQLFLYERFGTYAVYPTKKDKVATFKLVSGQQLSTELCTFKNSSI